MAQIRRINDAPLRNWSKVKRHCTIDQMDLSLKREKVFTRKRAIPRVSVRLRRVSRFINYFPLSRRVWGQGRRSFRLVQKNGSQNVGMNNPLVGAATWVARARSVPGQLVPHRFWHHVRQWTCTRVKHAFSFCNVRSHSFSLSVSLVGVTLSPLLRLTLLYFGTLLADSVLCVQGGKKNYSPWLSWMIEIRFDRNTWQEIVTLTLILNFEVNKIFFFFLFAFYWLRR